MPGKVLVVLGGGPGHRSFCVHISCKLCSRSAAFAYESQSSGERHGGTPQLKLSRPKSGVFEQQYKVQFGTSYMHLT